MNLEQRIARLEEQFGQIRGMRTAVLIAALTDEERQSVGEFGLFLRDTIAGRPEAERRDILTLAIRMLRDDVPTELQDLLMREDEEEKLWH